ncbi:MAG: hypothetical protein HYZ27_08120, partial [Deltaproteobacteria bacterium]|nr:hypothetical protein [Deltaproteobacteria bacterium]
MPQDLTLRRQGRKKRARVRVQEHHDSEASAGLMFARRWTTAGVDPMSAVEWQLRSAVITGEKGQVVFEQHNVEVPAFWSQLATNVVVSKYFRGAVGTPEREHSVRQLIGRVVNTITAWGEAGHYFATRADAEAFRDELTYLCLHQNMSFNSPVWFNLGVAGERPQASACFINSVEDTMESILDLAKTEGMLFKYGSGTGTNLSVLRGSKERLKGGGIASGPVSFMKGFDSFASAIKSGGKTRRAAKMVILDVDHPDIVQFINSKSNEEKKAWALIEAGYDAAVDGEAYSSVQFQNANHSVRITDEFMKAVVNDGVWKTLNRRDGSVAGSYEARDLMQQIEDTVQRDMAADCGVQWAQFFRLAWHKTRDAIQQSVRSLDTGPIADEAGR